MLDISTFSTTADIYANLDSHALDESGDCISDLLSSQRIVENEQTKSVLKIRHDANHTGKGY